ncbi:hypothetical protein CDEST_13193 [Colletotrichum destructivum]|uniref:Uncharacterized protein n=1 Tax=Colletotrichum destructivum TaxID=34406 RepID=A0AAX4IY05_9PEZI|nr:hypothetical protein CDEST_13193 [Colletotrichum destructivum]
MIEINVFLRLTSDRPRPTAPLSSSSFAPAPRLLGVESVREGREMAEFALMYKFSDPQPWEASALVAVLLLLLTDRFSCKSVVAVLCAFGTSNLPRDDVDASSLDRAGHLTSNGGVSVWLDISHHSWYQNDGI